MIARCGSPSRARSADLLGAGLGAAGGAVADGGSGAGKGAIIGGLAGAVLGGGYGAYQTKNECGTIFGNTFAAR